jgi:hypothetical protein
VRIEWAFEWISDAQRWHQQKNILEKNFSYFSEKSMRRRSSRNGSSIAREIPLKIIVRTCVGACDQGRPDPVALDLWCEVMSPS